MESGNSSSLQYSSSEADDEYNSRPTDVAFSAILSSSPFPPPPLPPSPANFNPAGSIQSPAWNSLRPLRPPHQDPPSCTQLPMTRPPPPPLPPSSSIPAALPRGSRKRARASRRAPTTVLTTDTTNFRRMVQEFTGIPSPPFPSFARPRLDLLQAAAAAASSSIRLGLVDPSNLLRPFAHKPATPPPPSPLTPTTSFPSPPTVTATPTTSSSSLVTAIDSYRPLPMQQQQQQQRRSTPVFTFQSLLEKEVAGTQDAGNLPGGVPTAFVASASSSGYVEQKGPENAPSTTQGTVDSSWICSLDH